jgi:hypothetical protein
MEALKKRCTGLKYEKSRCRSGERIDQASLSKAFRLLTIMLAEEW